MREPVTPPPNWRPPATPSDRQHPGQLAETGPAADELEAETPANPDDSDKRRALGHAVWPPAPTGHDIWRMVRVRHHDHGYWRTKTERGRVVRLWSRDVVIDQVGDVYCPSCLAFITLAELATPGSGHPVGPRWPTAPYMFPMPGNGRPVAEDLPASSTSRFRAC